MTRDKKRYIEALLYNYKDNKTRLIVLEEGLISDDDFILGSIDYSPLLLPLWMSYVRI